MHVWMLHASSDAGITSLFTPLRGINLSLYHFTSVQVFLHALGETAGAVQLPPGATRVLNSKACRTAVMFGESHLPTGACTPWL